MKKNAFLVTIQPASPQERPEQRVYTNADDVVAFVGQTGSAVLISEIVIYE